MARWSDTHPLQPRNGANIPHGLRGGRKEGEGRLKKSTSDIVGVEKRLKRELHFSEDGRDLSGQIYPQQHVYSEALDKSSITTGKPLGPEVLVISLLW